MKPYPLLLEPVLRVKVWGGRQLESVLGRTLPTAEPYGESWELHDSVGVVNGPLAGRTIGELLGDYGKALVGPDREPGDGMPLLVKLIDSAAWESVQVHPDDEKARHFEGEARGKTEAYYILSARPGAQIIIGPKPGTTREELIQASRNNRLPQQLVYADVQAGDALFLPAGTIHAGGPGILLYEIQQSSDVTYRLYDWERLGLDGKPRRLHVEKAAAVAVLDRLPEVKHMAGDERPVVEIARCDYFATFLHQLNAENGAGLVLDTAGRQFHSLTCIEGEAAVLATDLRVELPLGRTILIPADLGRYELRGPARVLRSFQP